MERRILFLFVSIYSTLAINNPWDFPTSGKSLNSDDTVTYPPLPVTQGIPIGNNVYNQVYVSSNAMITFRDGCYRYVPDRSFSKPHVAPYWTDLFPLGGTNGGCFNHQTYTDSVYLTMASDTVRNFTTFKNFQAKWVLVSTWLNVPFFPKSVPVVTVQCLLITDHVSTYTLFNYMNVNINNERHKIRISFDNGSPKDNPYSFTNEAYRMSKYVGNTGLRGIWFYTLAEDRNDCMLSPCKNGGICQDHYGDFCCTCPSNFVGKTCEKDVNECFTKYPCYHGTCNNTYGSYNCICSAGWTDSDCNNDINECLDVNICNHGSCVNTDGSFHCKCFAGWSGSRCDQDIDECITSSQCCNGGSCMNHPGSFSCNCGEGWTGSVCEKDVDECDGTPCLNGGFCYNSPGNYSCTCRPGLTNNLCTTDVNECQFFECWNNGTCTNTTSSFNCNCNEFYTGRFCEEDINECVAQPDICKNGGTCENLCGSYRCHCTPGNAGSNCDRDVNECLEWTTEPPCKHGGLCTNTFGSFQCNCTSNWTGSVCQEDVNECRSFPCQNNGTCYNFDGGYNCTCVPGFTGSLCELDFNECLSDPCKRHVLCVNTPGSFYCDCSDNWEGTTCDIDLCETKPANLVFVVDTSLSTSHRVFQQQKDFISNVVSRITLTDDKFKIAVASYGTNTSIDIGFNSYENNKTLLLDKISKISFINGTTDIHNASYSVRDILNVTKGSNQFVFFFTDGMPSNLHLALNGTGELRARLLNSTSSNELLFVSFGDDVRHEGYKRMSGDPHYKDVFTHTSMDPLYHVTRKLVDEKCTACFHQEAVDIMFLLDISSIQSQEIFSGSLGIVSSILEVIEQHLVLLGPKNVQMGAISFSNEPYLLMPLNETYDFNDFASKLMNLQQDVSLYKNVSSNVAEALEFSRFHLLSPAHGARESSRKVIIHIFTGFDANVTESVHVAQSITRDQITVFVIGVGHRYRYEDVLSIASSAFHAFLAEYDKNFHKWKITDTELEFISKISSSICTERVSA